jgi:pimeloyl-ACP methyl ester carboxylesterase
MTETPATFVAQHGWFRRIVRLLVVLVLLLAVAGFLYENISEARDRRFNSMAGKLVDVGGFKMHIDCTGEGSPTVILDSGLGDSYISWRKVQPQIAKFTRVCSYDRAGLGYSDSSSRPRTSQVMAEELHALLQAASIAPPYLLVGHSMGGYDVRLYASLYRKEVAGMVFVDASHPDQEKRFPPALKSLHAKWTRQLEFMEFAMSFGIPRMSGFCSTHAVVRAAECNFHTLREKVAEEKALSESAAQAAATAPLGDLPLAVLSHDPGEHAVPGVAPDVMKSVETAWNQMQEELSHLSTGGTRTIAKNSSHYIQMDRPDLVVEAVRTVLDEARAKDSASPPSHQGNGTETIP